VIWPAAPAPPVAALDRAALHRGPSDPLFPGNVPSVAAFMAGFGRSAVWHRAVTIRAGHDGCRSLSCRWEGFAVNTRRRRHLEADTDRALGGVFTGLGRHTTDVLCGASVPLARLRLITALYVKPRSLLLPRLGGQGSGSMETGTFWGGYGDGEQTRTGHRGELSRRRPGMGRGRRDQALRRRLVVPWAAHRSVRPRQAERRPAAGNPPPFLSLRLRAASAGSPSSRSRLTLTG
jgi:hypothetical protein